MSSAVKTAMQSLRMKNLKNNVKLVMVDSEADFTEDFLKSKYRVPAGAGILRVQRNLADGNTHGYGTSKYWMIVQQLATVDATTFDMYLANMRTMIMEQLFPQMS